MKWWGGVVVSISVNVLQQAASKMYAGLALPSLQLPNTSPLARWTNMLERWGRW